MVVRRFFCLLSVLSCAYGGASSIEVRKLTELRKRLGVDPYDSAVGLKERLRTLKVAILDKGFGEISTIATELPPSVFTVVPTYNAAFIEKNKLGDPKDQKPFDEKEDHGRVMALSLWAVTGYSPTVAPQIYLMNANGLTNFERAVHYCKEQKIDVILFSQNWEYGGNFDGRGFINRIVSVATSAGIFWVNAAGNYGRRVHNSPVTVGTGGWVRLGQNGYGLRLNSRLDRNPLKIILSWNQYSEVETSGTDKDLDLFVVSDTGQEMLKADLKQVPNRPGVERVTGESYVPREIIEGKLSRGNYFIKVKSKGGTFNAADRLRITLLPSRQPYYDDAVKETVEPFEFPDATEGSEIMVPADHPQVIAVGDKSQLSAVGPTADGRAKPDLVLESSQIDFTDGDGSSGTSNAAALFAGVLTVLKAHQPLLTTEDLLRFTRSERVTAARRTGERAGIEDLGIEPFRLLQGGVMSAIEGILGKGSVQLAGRKRDGSYLVALDRSPLELNRFFTNLPPIGSDPQTWEMFLVQVREAGGRGQVYAFWRDPRRPGTETWETVLTQNPERFVRVVQSSRVQEGTLPVLPLWQTPLPDRLLTTTRR